LSWLWGLVTLIIVVAIIRGDPHPYKPWAVRLGVDSKRRFPVAMPDGSFGVSQWPLETRLGLQEKTGDRKANCCIEELAV